MEDRFHFCRRRHALIVLATIALSVPLFLTLYGRSTAETAAADVLVKSRSRTDETTSRLRLEIAMESIRMMQSDTQEEANKTMLVDISPYVDLVEEALEEIGVRGVFGDLFLIDPFAEALREAASSFGLTNFTVETKLHHLIPKGQPIISYHGIPNNRDIYNKEANCFGSHWWLVHYAGALSADKILKEKKLLLSLEENTNDNGQVETIRHYAHTPTEVIREIQLLTHGSHPDISQIHSEHAFIWQYMALTSPPDKPVEFPVALIEEWCGLEYGNPIEGLSANDGQECLHGFGHGLYFTLASRKEEAIKNPRIQLRPAAGFSFSNDERFDAYDICLRDSPNEALLRNCYSGFHHSYFLLWDGNAKLSTMFLQDIDEFRQAVKSYMEQKQEREKESR